MKFNSAVEMLDFINGENGTVSHDLYSPKRETYVFSYNDARSIATYHITKEEAKKLSEESKAASGEYWGAFLGPGGEIWDDVSHECYRDGQVSNFEKCEELIEYDDWIITDYYDDSISVEVTMPIELTKENIDDIVCTALEGGINYWCSDAEVADKMYYGEYASEQISRGGSLKLYDAEAEKPYTLTLRNFIEGFKKWVSNGYDTYSAVHNGKVDCCNIDANKADQIIQFALFGEVIYA